MKKNVIIFLFIFIISVFTIQGQEINRYLRFSFGSEEIKYGKLVGNQIFEISSAPYFKHQIKTIHVPLDSVRLHPPVIPGKVIAVGLNFKSHSGNAGAERPALFAKFPSSLAAPGADIIPPEGASNLHYEGELVLVIGKRGKNIPVNQAFDYIFGVTAGNDISERTWQFSDTQWIRGKASDSFAPLGPYIVTNLNYNDLLITTRLNGKVVQSESTKELIHSADKIVSFISTYITLEPGDIIFTGTPGSTRAMKEGDIVEIEVEGVGILKNRIKF